MHIQITDSGINFSLVGKSKKQEFFCNWIGYILGAYWTLLELYLHWLCLSLCTCSHPTFGVCIHSPSILVFPKSQETTLCLDEHLENRTTGGAVISQCLLGLTVQIVSFCVPQEEINPKCTNSQFPSKITFQFAHCGSWINKAPFY